MPAASAPPFQGSMTPIRAGSPAPIARACAIHLSVMTPERVANKRFATPAFDLDAHLAEQVAKFERRR